MQWSGKLALKVYVKLVAVKIRFKKQVIWGKLTRRATDLAVPIPRLSLSISIHFDAIYSKNLQHSHKLQKTLNPYFKSSRSFKVIDVDTNKKFVIIACYDKQRVWAYLQPFLRYTSQ